MRILVGEIFLWGDRTSELHLPLNLWEPSWKQSRHSRQVIVDPQFIKLKVSWTWNLSLNLSTKKAAQRYTSQLVGMNRNKGRKFVERFSTLFLGFFKWSWNDSNILFFCSLQTYLHRRSFIPEQNSPTAPQWVKQTKTRNNKKNTRWRKFFRREPEEAK